MYKRLRRGKTVPVFVLLVLVAGVFALASPGRAGATVGDKPTLTKDVDANGDAVFSDTENVPKTVSYPWTVTFRLTYTGGSFDHKIVALTDSTTSDLGSCAAWIGTTIPANTTVSCTYTETLAAAGTAPFVNTAMLTYDNAGNDVLSNTATVNFPGMSLDKSSTTTLVTFAGQVVPYSYLVTNTGTSELTGITLVDNNTDSPPSCPATSLPVGGSMTCTGQHTVSFAELMAGGNLVNVATASSNEAPDATDTVSIPIVRPSSNTGGLTMGFWSNKNGQGIISGQAKSGVCPSTSWLRGYAPFQDLSSSATCSDVASYVYKVIKGGGTNCGGTTCNAMLKAQMLATALNVYFSDPALGGNKLNAPVPIGSVAIDLLHPTNVSSAFGGATGLTVSQMLAYAASQSNAGGSTWYGNVKATQVLAKDAFDAINNQTAIVL
jgi:hypothetical protein